MSAWTETVSHRTLHIGDNDLALPPREATRTCTNFLEHVSCQPVVKGVIVDVVVGAAVVTAASSVTRTTNVALFENRYKQECSLQS